MQQNRWYELITENPELHEWFDSKLMNTFKNLKIKKQQLALNF